MSIRKLFEGLGFAGQADGDRLTYNVFAGKEAFLVVAANRRGGFNVNVVDRKAPDAISRRFHGKKITAGQLAKRGGWRGDRFGALNALYAMVALKRARKLKERDGRSILFKVN